MGDGSPGFEVFWNGYIRLSAMAETIRLRPAAKSDIGKNVLRHF